MIVHISSGCFLPTITILQVVTDCKTAHRGGSKATLTYAAVNPKAESILIHGQHTIIYLCLPTKPALS